MISLTEYAKRHGKSRSTAMKYWRQGRIKGAKLRSTVVGEVIVVPDNAAWPKAAKPGELTKKQRDAWPKGRKE